MSNFCTVRIRFRYFISESEQNFGYPHTLSDSVTRDSGDDDNGVNVIAGSGGGWLQRSVATASPTDGRAVLREGHDAAVGGQPCHNSTSHGWHTHGGFGGGGGGCLGGGAGGGYTGEYS